MRDSWSSGELVEDGFRRGRGEGATSPKARVLRKDLAEDRPDIAFRGRPGDACHDAIGDFRYGSR